MGTGEVTGNSIILNLGCGSKVSADCINIDWAIHLRIARSRSLYILASPFLSEARRKYILGLGDNVLLHNLKKGIPFNDNSVDVIYHSHMLEHIDREDVEGFQREVMRVLKPGGIQRVCVPDLGFLVARYSQSLKSSREDVVQQASHDTFVGDILTQCVRKEAAGTSSQPPLRRWIENLLLGGARRRGETHQWMYDDVNLAALLRECGFTDVTREGFNRSNIDGWVSLGLEVKENGQEYKPDSLYMEAVKP